ncbi:Uncharacterised protein [Mycobacteroides abscessus subsp. massiliense]|uniref:hypothetical protein n=1 Tax=Mycobacteroides abscessus TaxID=36809 RepID=UPI0009A68416|nr:hypothetical protein [Mycobacteroides abscessus]SKE70812.1 Uncharacterised protein [Mycobacteroides abscessus subsp. massiliense]SKH80483.1 Uncharacterised protein [Mycobacteroides abscessus subsp. massiliense]SKI34219.1 Uncharacterised protein [Mycobacteroides abscessus subsp. massiliense]SKJ37013.1 Uncharacterised protein [Mycobacteroides abscessus subsp. massiliense]SKK23151.1 Uncharacterised protein [Mycobacteroides abscessus subsp. massiliense]
MSKFRTIITSRTTLVAALALALGVLLTLAFTPRHEDGVAPPAAVAHRVVGNACQLSVVAFDGRTWTAAPGDQQLRRVDGVGNACTPAVITDRVSVDGKCVRVLRVDGRTYALSDRDGDGPLQAAQAEATTAVTGCRADPSR